MTTVWYCDSCGVERVYDEKGGQYPYVDRVRYDGRMCQRCFVVSLILFDPDPPIASVNRIRKLSRKEAA